MNKRVSSNSGLMSNRQRGLSLIELMIATTLGLIIVAAMTQLYGDVVGANREMAKTNSQIENARFAIQQLRNDIVHAGYWGAHVPDFDNLMVPGAPTDKPTIVPDPCLAYASWGSLTGPIIYSMIGIPVQAYEGSPSANCNTLLTGELTTAGTDVLVVRHADTCVADGTNCAADASGPVYFQVSNCLSQLSAPPYYQLSDTGFTSTYERDCSTIAPKLRFVQNIYFIKNNAQGIPSLYRSEYGLSGGTPGQLNAQELIPGVDRFRVELGFDTVSESGATLNSLDYDAAVAWQDPDVWDVATNRGDGIPDGAFVHCNSGTPCTVFQLTNTVAAKIYVLVRADQPSPGYIDSKTYNLGTLTNVGPFNDNYKRHVFSTTVRINNVAARRETP
ncbi:prepilin-type N-terminal cleavage/methylation domain-containing protein [Seongchinamella unica]|uniref:Prepilin-type N-terminal cleavage/methylation domain-containing protein n=1 Tax=Seongchinamella unica TaxID=2547392 RepID=A0A4R5LPP0_9GAMM|nr:PilW family protein [Seongchinamella unica]TDG12366.1 prepilin-type N-terminal cleavage/methylation domain-containing protein [Seongchinamella unica]